MVKQPIIASEPGFITIDRGSGPPVRYPTGSRLLASVLTALIRTMIERDLIDEDFADNCGMNLDLDGIIAAIEEVGGLYHNPDLHDMSVH